MEGREHQAAQLPKVRQMMDTIRKLFRKPTPLERAARELGTIEHAMLDVGAEILWAEKREQYYELRRAQLKEYVQENAK